MRGYGGRTPGCRVGEACARPRGRESRRLSCNVHTAPFLMMAMLVWEVGVIMRVSGEYRDTAPAGWDGVTG